MSIDPKFVKLTADVLKYFNKMLKVTAYQFGTVGSSPTEFFFGGGVADFYSRMLY